MKIDNGGPAFPRPYSEDTRSGTCPDGNCPVDEQDGMSLRDYFAGMAMQGMMDYVTAREARETPETTARAAYKMADAMLKARKESP